MDKDTSQPLLYSVPMSSGPPQYTYRPVSYQAIPLQTQPPVYRRSPLRRFIAAFLVAVGIYALLRTLIHHRHRLEWRSRWDVPSGAVLHGCVDGNDWEISDALTSEIGAFPHSTKANFGVRLEPESVLQIAHYGGRSFFSRYGSLSGAFDVTTSPVLKRTATITVTSFHGTPSNQVKACLVTGKGNVTGVGIFTKRSWLHPRWDPTALKIELMVPEESPHLQLKGLVADLPNFALNIGDLQNFIDFKSVSLRTSNSAVHVKSLSAGEATLHTSNGPISADSLTATKLTLKTSDAGISGSYNASHALSLITSNAPINVDVGLQNHHPARPTTLHMRTSNHQLNASISLSTPDGAFDATARTSNRRLTLAFPAFARAAALSLKAGTSNAAAEVALHSAYEGAFGLRTSAKWSSAVRRLNGPGHGDERQIDYEYEHGERELRGYVYSREENKERGRVEVRTSNAPVTLFV
ncbi:hypothetical protein B0H11DRAFT_1963738 [Mycena galericulata]|nr:hypothetical protein B0H11DRAFT_1963738 [Mycena galericulata]